MFGSKRPQSSLHAQLEKVEQPLALGLNVDTARSYQRITVDAAKVSVNAIKQYLSSYLPLLGSLSTGTI